VKKIFIASTNLHLIISVILNSQDSLVFIGENSIFFQTVSSSFENVLLLEEKKDKYKIQRRIENSQKLIHFVKQINPDEIIVGNDRKIETAILLKKYSCFYSYMDDGLHSYILERNHLFKYTFFERIYKKFLYKNQLVLPKYIGTDKYIKKAYLFKPEYAHTLLKDKKLEKINIDKEILKTIFIKIVPDNIQKKLKSIKKIIFLPHPKFISDYEMFIALIDEDTMVKLHPRDTETVLDVEILPSNISSEALSPFISSQTRIYGFCTTAILTLRWFRDDLDIFYLEEENEFFEKNDIKKAIIC
jgi:hypothetical protein